jgi:hypothetical protein
MRRLVDLLDSNWAIGIGIAFVVLLVAMVTLWGWDWDVKCLIVECRRLK